jgi:alanine racemase
LWIKVNTGMNRLGFKPDELQAVMTALHSCSWVHKDIGLMTHIASSDQADRIENSEQISLFQSITTPGFSQRSMANSAAIISFPQTHADAVRPGIMLFGVSPFANQTASDLGLIPVMRFQSAISAIRPIPHGAQVGYGGDWKSNKPSVMGIVAVGYGDGYPRHIGPHTPVWVNGREVYIIGRISMDMLAIDLTDHKDIQEGDTVQLWGDHILVERIAQSAGTVGYELLCQISERVRYY